MGACRLEVKMFEKEYSQYWKTVVETMLDGLMVVDPGGIILSVNNAFEALTGYKEEELIGQPCSILACNTCFRSRELDGAKHCELFTKGKVGQIADIEIDGKEHAFSAVVDKIFNCSVSTTN